jgi:hypothetical protein
MLFHLPVTLNLTNSCSAQVKDPAEHRLVVEERHVTRTGMTVMK